MGCINSKKDLSDINPNIYRVINVNAEGLALWSGQLEISPKELILYRKGKDPTKWSLQHLRRYGFDADLFTFEAGRRCTTGEGIYAFRCRRAESLFHLLQTYIQGIALNDDGTQQIGDSTFNGPNSTLLQSSRSSRQPLNSNSRPNSLGQNPSGGVGSAGIGFGVGANYVIPNSRTQSLSPNGTLHSSNPSRSTDTLTAEGNYLEPTPMRSNFGTRYSSGIRLSSVSSGPISPEPNSPGSPNSFILEVTQLNQQQQQQQQYQNSNLYQEFPLRSLENNNNLLNKKLSLDIPPQEPAPILTASAVAQHQQQIVHQSNSILSADGIPISPTDNDPSHMYVNVTPVVTTNQLNFGFSRLSSSYSIDPSTRCYENLEPGEFRAQQQLMRTRYSKPDIFAKVDLPPLQSQNSILNDKSEPSTPTIKQQQQQQQQQNRKVNYIVLDLDQSPSSTSLTTSTSAQPISSTSISSTITITTGNSTISTKSLSSSTMGGSGSHQQMNSNTILGIQTNSLHSNNNNINNNNNNLNTSNNNNLNNVSVNKQITPISTTISTSSQIGGTVSNLLPPESPKKASLGYATIDFNKTVALSNSTAPSDSEGSRKTRHSSTAARQSNSISD